MSMLFSKDQLFSASSVSSVPSVILTKIRAIRENPRFKQLPLEETKKNSCNPKQMDSVI